MISITVVDAISVIKIHLLACYTTQNDRMMHIVNIFVAVISLSQMILISVIYFQACCTFISMDGRLILLIFFVENAQSNSCNY